MLVLNSSARRGNDHIVSFSERPWRLPNLIIIRLKLSRWCRRLATCLPPFLLLLPFPLTITHWTNEVYHDNLTLIMMQTTTYKQPCSLSFFLSPSFFLLMPQYICHLPGAISCWQTPTLHRQAGAARAPSNAHLPHAPPAATRCHEAESRVSEGTGKTSCPEWLPSKGTPDVLQSQRMLIIVDTFIGVLRNPRVVSVAMCGE